MNFQVVSVLFVVFVTRMEALTNDDTKEILPRQITDNCDYFPQMKCSSDCSSLLVCHDETSPPINFKCPATRPYCLNGKCGSVNGNCRVNTNSNLLSDFVCTSNGTFPDPTNCTQYYKCNGTQSTQFSCPAGFIYNSKFNRCDRGVPRVDHGSWKICQKISCQNKPNGNITFPANPAFYATCSNEGGVQSMTMYKCNDIQNEVFDVTSGKCVFKCRSAGIFPDPSNCTQYYVCEGWIKFKFTLMHCLDDEYFDGTGCVPGICGVTVTTPPYQGPPTGTPSYQGPSTGTPPNQGPSTGTPPNQGPSTGTTPNQGPSTGTPSTSADSYLGPHNGAFMISDEVEEAGHGIKKTTMSPIFPFNPLWKHKGKYSIRLANNFKQAPDMIKT